MDAQTARLRVNWAELTVAAVGAPAVMVAVGWMAKACGAVMRDGGVKAAAKMVRGGWGVAAMETEARVGVLEVVVDTVAVELEEGAVVVGRLVVAKTVVEATGTEVMVAVQMVGSDTLIASRGQ